MFEAIVRNGILTTVAALIISVIGVVAALRVPVQMIPDLEVRTVSIETAWPGATPQDVEKEILIEQEEYLRTLPNLQRLESSASSGSAVIELDFPFGVDMTQTLIEVNNALNQVPSYPENVDEPRVYASSFSSNSFMYFAISPSAGQPAQPRHGHDARLHRRQCPHAPVRRARRVADQCGRRRGPPDQDTAGPGKTRRSAADDSRCAQCDPLAQPRCVRRRDRQRQTPLPAAHRRAASIRLQTLEDLIIERRGDSLIRLSDVASVELDHFEIRSAVFFQRQPDHLPRGRPGARLECHRHQVRDARRRRAGQAGSARAKRHDDAS